MCYNFNWFCVIIFAHFDHFVVKEIDFMRIFLFVWRCNLVKSKPLEHESMRAIDAKRFKINYYVIAKWIVVPIQKWWMLWREDWQFVGMSFDFKCESMLLHITINMTRTNPISFTLNDNKWPNESCAGNVMKFCNNVTHSMRCRLCENHIHLDIIKLLFRYIDTVLTSYTNKRHSLF